jgi:hypothetical protein
MCFAIYRVLVINQGGYRCRSPAWSSEVPVLRTGIILSHKSKNIHTYFRRERQRSTKIVMTVLTLV